MMLFDLDGTLSDSARGILGSLRAAFDQHGIEFPDEQQQQRILGPPLATSIPEFVAPELVAPVIAAYREFYEARGLYDADVYDGIPEVLDWLRNRGVVLAVATSKAEYFARTVVKHLGLTDYFATICGDTLDGERATKALVVGEALRRLGGPDPAEVVMVGDREHDVIGAAAHGIRCLGAGWGYAREGELRDAGAVASFQSPHELYAALPTLLPQST